MEEALLKWLRQILANAPDSLEHIERLIAQSPGRISQAYEELLSGYHENPQDLVQVTAPLEGQAYTGLISAVDVPFLSMCAHHFLPFHGLIDVVYEPGEFILGIGKIPRLVQCRARRFQIQEFLVRDIAADFMNFVKAKGVFVRARAVHMCVCYRGPRSYGTSNAVMFSAGTLRDPSDVDYRLLLNGCVERVQ